MRSVRVVAALIERTSGSGPTYLAQRRAPTETRPLLWEFPGGKVEPREDDATALRRELQEELGCEVDVGEQVDRAEHRYADLALDLILYRCTVVGGEPRALHAAALTWGTPAQLAALPFTEADVPFVQRLLTIGPRSAPR